MCYWKIRNREKKKKSVSVIVVPAEILEQLLKKIKTIKNHEPCSLFTKGQLEIERIRKSEVTQLMSNC